MDDQQSPIRELALFAGAGGGILGGSLLGWRCVCAVERDRYAASVLVARQNDGSLPPFPIWDDVETFDGRPWRGHVDIVSGGFPCQDISTAGKGAGIENGVKSGLWREFARVVREIRPRFVFVENSPALTSRGLGRVLGDLAEVGYDAEWGVLGAEDAIWLTGDPVFDHERERIWIIAHREASNATRERFGEKRQLRYEQSAKRLASGCKETAIDKSIGRRSGKCAVRNPEALATIERSGGTPANGELCGCEGGGQTWTGANADLPSGWWSAEPGVGRMADGVAHRVDRIRTLGNGQVGLVAALAARGLGGPVMKNPG